VDGDARARRKGWSAVGTVGLAGLRPGGRRRRLRQRVGAGARGPEATSYVSR